MAIRIREATPEDLPTLLEFKQHLVQVERPFDPTIPEEGDVFYYDVEALIHDSNTYFIVAENESDLLGCSYNQIRDGHQWSTSKTIGYIGFLFVAESARGQGIGKQLTMAGVDWIRAQGVTDIRLDVYALNTHAINAYRKMGFVQHYVEMRLDSSDDTRLTSTPANNV